MRVLPVRSEPAKPKTEPSMGGNSHIAHTILGVLGNVANCVFFLSSMPTIVRIVKLRSSGGLSGNLYVFKLFNCMLWTFYGLPFIHPHDFWVVLTNSFGCGFALIYIVPYLIYATGIERFSVLWKLVLSIGSFVLMTILVLTIDHSQQHRIRVVGILCAIISSGMHMTLLSQCRLAIHTKEMIYLQPTSSITGFFKGAIWIAYGIVNFDIFIVIPNGVGVIIGVIQGIMVIVLMRNKTSKTKDTQVMHDPNGGLKFEESKIHSRKNSMQVAPVEVISHPTNNGNSSFKGEVEIQQISSRVSSLLGISRQSSMSATVVPVMMDEVEEGCDNLGPILVVL